MTINPFPLEQPIFRHEFRIRAIEPAEPLLHQTSRYDEEIALKRQLLSTRVNDCVAATEASSLMQQEAVELLRSRCEPKHPLALPMEAELLPHSLAAAAVHIQEDLVLLRNDAENGYPVIAGCVCFPAGWSIADKLGQSLAAVHAPVPEFDTRLLHPSLRLFARLKVGRSVCRSNWGVRAVKRLAQFPSDAAEIVAATEKVATGSVAECQFRVEYQTLSRLPESGNILFTIHTVQRSLKELTKQQRETLTGVIATCPEPTLRYKGIWPMRGPLLAFLNTAS